MQSRLPFREGQAPGLRSGSGGSVLQSCPLNLAIALKCFDEQEESIHEVEALLAKQMDRYEESFKVLVLVPGTGLTAACIIWAEIRVEMSHWLTENTSQPGLAWPQAIQKAGANV